LYVFGALAALAPDFVPKIGLLSLAGESDGIAVFLGRG